MYSAEGNVPVKTWAHHYKATQYRFATQDYSRRKLVTDDSFLIGDDGLR